MKKIISILVIVIIMCLGMSACSDNTNTAESHVQYNRHELQTLQNDILRTMRKLKHVPLVGIGINETEGYVEITVQEKEVHNFKSLIALWKLQKQYGDALKIRYMTSGTSIDVTTYNSSNDSSRPFSILGISLIAFAGLYFAHKQKQLAQLSTNTNETISFTSPYTKRKVKRMIKQSYAPLPENLDDKIFRKIELDQVSHS